LFNLTQAGAWSEILIGWLTEFLKCKGVYDAVTTRREREERVKPAVT